MTKLDFKLNKKEDKTVDGKHSLPNFHLPTKKKFYEKNMAKRQ